jgi:hypothetical protein
MSSAVSINTYSSGRASSQWRMLAKVRRWASMLISPKPALIITASTPAVR